MYTPKDSVLLEVNDLEVKFPVEIKTHWWKSTKAEVTAVDKVSLSIKHGETIGLVGESGSGKTTVGRAILRAIDPSGGEVNLHLSGQKTVTLSRLNQVELRDLRPKMSMVFQDPYSSLNPRMTIRDIIAEPLIASNLETDRSKIDARVKKIATECKLDIQHLRRFPHAFSGGQRQRICIARALITNPDFVVCDESVSALDVSTQAEIINLLQDIQEKNGVSFLFIAHDLSVVAQISHRIAVMYVGKLMEIGPTKSIFSTPRHPYTHALLSAIPHIQPDKDFKPVKLTGEIPSPMDAPSGCRFHTRCPFATELCQFTEPAWRALQPDHFVACHHSENLDFTK